MVYNIIRLWAETVLANGVFEDTTVKKAKIFTNNINLKLPLQIL